MQVAENRVMQESLSHEQFRKVARLQMKDVVAQVAGRGITVAITDAALDHVLRRSYDPVYGARPIRRWVEKRVVTGLSRMLVREEIDEECSVFIDMAPTGDGLSYRVEKNGGLVNASRGPDSDILIRKTEKQVKRSTAEAVQSTWFKEIVEDDETREETEDAK